MKQLFLILLLSFTHWGYGQTIRPELKSILDATILKAKENSYYSSSLNWDSLETEIYSSISSADSISDLKPAFETLLNGIRDHHGRVINLLDYSILAHFTDQENARFTDNRKFDPETWAVVNDIESRFEYELLSNNIGYLRVVGIGPNVDGQAEAERIRSAILKLHAQNVDKWIIDLRYNGGGNINVMMAGLAPLLDSRCVATIRDEDNEIMGTAEVKKGNFWYFGLNVFELENTVKIKSPKIAVLTSRWTASSGELVAVCFKGQANTKFFGEATGGYTTNTGWDVINNEIALVIATGVYCDRNGQSYDQNIEPDTEVLFAVEEDHNRDLGIKEAVNWLTAE